MKKLVTESDILKLIKDGSRVLHFPSNSIFTPLALDRIKSSGIKIELGANNTPNTVENLIDLSKPITLASDHTGYRVKTDVFTFLKEKSYLVQDVGCSSEDAVDYPDFAIKAANEVKKGISGCAIIFDATGIPSAITANKIRGIRAATCYNEFSARSSRAHNNANVLVLGAKTLGIETIKSVIATWLNTPFEGGRHQKRIDKISQLEK